MANGFGSLYVGSSGLRSAQNSLNTIANNLSNVDTKGYVRQQVIFEDAVYQRFDKAAVSDQYAGTGVGIADIIHWRDQFIDRTARTAFGRESYYSTCYEGTQEVETLLRELSGAGYSNTIDSMYQSMAEFAKDPSDTANQNVLMQTSALFLEQTKAIYDSIKDYQTNLNQKITDDVDRINKLGDDIHKLNIAIQRIEAAGVETAMDLRDARDMLIDELSGLASIEYSENEKGVVQLKVEGTYLVTEGRSYHMETYYDGITGFKTPYWAELSEPDKDQYYEVFRTKGIDASKKNDVGELKALLLTRGDHFATYLDIEDLTPEAYENYLSSSVAMNTQAELDSFIHSFATAINELISPTTEFSNTPEAQGVTYPLAARDVEGHTYEITKDTLVLDLENAVIGTDGAIPPHEMFVRAGCDRFTPVLVELNGETKTLYMYNEEDPDDISKCYTTGQIKVNDILVKDPTKIGFKHTNGDIAYDMSENFTSIWGEKGYHLNPTDTTPCDFTGFYVKIVGDLSNKGSVYRTTSETLNQVVESVETSRQGVIGVSSDEELVSMIKFQNAYNASSRYMTVVSQMIEHLVTTLGR